MTALYIATRRILLSTSVFSLPTDIPGLKLWLKADALALANNDPVTTWADSSGNANDVTQATAAKKPTFKTNIQAGKPVVRADGVDDFLYGAGLNINGYAVASGFIVVKYIATDTVRIPWGWETGIGATGFAPSLIVGGNFQAGLGTGGVETLVGADAADTNFHVHTLTYISASMIYYRDGTLNASSTARTGNISSDQGVGVCNQATEIWPANVDIAEIVFYNQLLSASERADVTRYLGQKWGVAVS